MSYCTRDIWHPPHCEQCTARTPEAHFRARENSRMSGMGNTFAPSGTGGRATRKSPTPSRSHQSEPLRTRSDVNQASKINSSGVINPFVTGCMFKTPAAKANPLYRRNDIARVRNVTNTATVRRIIPRGQVVATAAHWRNAFVSSRSSQSITHPTMAVPTTISTSTPMLSMGAR